MNHITRNFKDLKECHVKPNLLLIYKINDDILELTLVQVLNHGSLLSKISITIVQQKAVICGYSKITAPIYRAFRGFFGDS